MIAHDMARAIQRIEHLYSALRPPLSITQYLVLSSVMPNMTHREAQISERTGLQQPVVKQVIHNLVKRKFVKRTSKGVIRSMILTPAGERALEKAKVAIVRSEIDFLEPLHPEDQGRFINLLSMTT